jgi:ABC-type nickel/cobalt efflux system permease component RcnA
MATVTHEPQRVNEKGAWTSVLVRETWASLAIAVIWLSVALDALFGPNITATSAAGDTVSLPSAVVVAFFAFFATWIVARYGLRRERAD